VARLAALIQLGERRALVRDAPLLRRNHLNSLQQEDTAHAMSEEAIEETGKCSTCMQPSPKSDGAAGLKGLKSANERWLEQSKLTVSKRCGGRKSLQSGTSHLGHFAKPFDVKFVNKDNHWNLVGDEPAFLTARRAQAAYGAPGRQRFGFCCQKLAPPVQTVIANLLQRKKIPENHRERITPIVERLNWRASTKYDADSQI